MASIRVLALVAALCALSACDPSGSDGTPSSTPSAHAGFGAPAATEVTEATFRTPSKNIVCALTPSEVRCDIAHKKWNLPTKPADCDFGWGNGIHLEAASPAFTCAGDTLLGAATQTLEYGSALRSGDILCRSESTGLTCKNEKTVRGFTMSTARYSFF